MMIILSFEEVDTSKQTIITKISNFTVNRNYSIKVRKQEQLSTPAHILVDILRTKIIFSGVGDHHFSFIFII